MVRPLPYEMGARRTAARLKWNALITQTKWAYTNIWRYQHHLGSHANFRARLKTFPYTNVTLAGQLDGEASNFNSSTASSRLGGKNSKPGFYFSEE